MKVSIIDGHGKVVNVVAVPDTWTGSPEDDWQCPEGCTWEINQEATLGAVKKGNNWEPRARRKVVITHYVPTATDRIADLEERIAALEAR